MLEVHACSVEPLPSWYALYTKSRQEDRAAGNLAAWGIQTLVPKLRLRSSAGLLQNLFPSYIFARFDALAMLQKIRFTRGVSYVVSFGGKPAEVTDEIIAAIYRRIDDKGIVCDTASFKPGDAVVIEAGPLRDFEGMFEQELSDHERVRILLTTVAYGARVEVSKCDLRRRLVNQVA